MSEAEIMNGKIESKSSLPMANRGGIVNYLDEIAECGRLWQRLFGPILTFISSAEDI